jgi:esterase/lipase superfamily enzyme
MHSLDHNMKLFFSPYKKAVTLFCFIQSTFWLLSCSSNQPYQIELMATPEVFNSRKIDPFKNTSIQHKHNAVQILYATDREPIKQNDEEIYYENERGYVLRLGYGIVSIGDKDATWEYIKKISLQTNRDTSVALQVTQINELGILDSTYSKFELHQDKQGISHKPKKEYARLINKQLTLSQQKDIYIYVHGYKVIFENPLLVATELWHYLGYDGVFIAYSWPSTPNKWAYLKDMETGKLSARNLRLFIEYLASETEVENIHILGYSAGTRLVTLTLEELALIHLHNGKDAVHKELKLNNVILVGSDMDRDVMGSFEADGFLNVQKHFTVYSSDSDMALDLSSWIFGRRRFSQPFEEGTIHPLLSGYLWNNDDLIMIDATLAKDAATGNGHGYFHNSPWVSSDILMTLKHGLLPKERGLKRTQDLPVWSFSNDSTSKLQSNLSDTETLH